VAVGFHIEVVSENGQFRLQIWNKFRFLNLSNLGKLTPFFVARIGEVRGLLKRQNNLSQVSINSQVPSKVTSKPIPSIP
jgi:hypothetical protein